MPGLASGAGPGRRKGHLRVLLLIFAASSAAGLSAWWWRQPLPAPPLHEAQPPATVPAPSDHPPVSPASLANPVPPSPPVVAAPREVPFLPSPPLLSEPEILALHPSHPVLLRLRENPAIFVIVWPDLDTQAAGMNRVAALVEKDGLPRDRVASEAELNIAYARTNDSAATWLLGHDYRLADLERFFALAGRDGIALGSQELWLRDQLAIIRGLRSEGQPAALITIAAPDPRQTDSMRAAVLHHELGHGHYFTVPDFAAHVQQTWQERLSEAERQAFRDFLGREGYNAADEELMANETMAYLLFTPDPRFFTARHVGMTEAAVERLRSLFRTGSPRR